MFQQTDINIGIYESDRKEIAYQLSILLADSYLLNLKTQNYHWNVTGQSFGELHLQFEKQYQEISKSIDEIAEAIRGLGYYAPATFIEFQKRSSIQEKDGLLKSDEMILDLMIAHELVIETARNVFDSAEDGEDHSTMDLAVRRISAHEKHAWMLRSYLNN